MPPNCGFEKTERRKPFATHRNPSNLFAVNGRESTSFRKFSRAVFPLSCLEFQPYAAGALPSLGFFAGVCRLGCSGRGVRSTSIVASLSKPVIVDTQHAVRIWLTRYCYARGHIPTYEQVDSVSGRRPNMWKLLQFGASRSF